MRTLDGISSSACDCPPLRRRGLLAALFSVAALAGHGAPRSASASRAPRVELDHFEWSAVASPQHADVPFAVTLTAKDADDGVFSGFGGTVNLTAFSGNLPEERTVGAGASTWNYPLTTLYHDARTQAIYLAGDLGGAGTISSLALDVHTAPGIAMSSWTVRMKHTALARYDAPAWEGDGWVTVYQADQTVPGAGWTMFNFSQHFDYNGTDNLMVDFSFNNSTYSTEGLVKCTDVGASRSICYRTDSGYGDNPLAWSGAANPTPETATKVPNIKLGVGGRFLDVAPTATGGFSNGVLTGTVTVGAAASDVRLRADDGSGHVGQSAAFEVLAFAFTEFPFSGSFEDDLDGWQNGSGSDFQWTKGSGATPSTDTGPAGAKDGGSYLFTEASSPNNPEKTAHVEAAFDFSAQAAPTLTFYYHMYGAEIGSLHVDVNDGAWHNDAWSAAGQQHTSSADDWSLATVDLTAYAGKNQVSVRFRAVTGAGHRGDMAIDYVSVYDANALSVTTADTHAVGATSVASGGTVIADGGLAVTSRGVCWSTAPNPTIADSTTTDGDGLGAFTSSITGLTPATTYHLRAYATNSGGLTAYGADVTVTTASPTDSFPYAEGFETGLGVWWQAEGSDIDWTRISGETQSTETGPLAAHEGSQYLYVEASGAANSTAGLESVFDFTSMAAPVLQFHYHMYGAGTGSLSVDIHDATWQNDRWTVSGQQHSSSDEPWTLASLDLSAYGGKGDVSIRFRGVTGSSYTSDIAIDNLRLLYGQTITFGALAEKACGDPTFDLTAGASSGLPVSYVSSDPSVASIAGATVTVLRVGTTTITASQAGNSQYAPAASVQQALTVVKGTPPVTWNNPDAISYPTPLGEDQLDAAANVAGAFTYDPPAGTVLEPGAGQVLSVNFAPNDTVNWNPVVGVTTRIDVNKGSQTITFDSLPTKTYGDEDFSLTASASSTLPVSFAGDDPAVATVAGTTVDVVGAGTVTITASQAGNDYYNAAPQVQQELTVAKKALSATGDNKTRPYGTANPSFTVTYTGIADGDAPGDIDSPPSTSCSATSTSAPGKYAILLAHNGSDANYAFTVWNDGELTITDGTPAIDQTGPLSATMDEDGAPTAWTPPTVTAANGVDGALTWSVADGQGPAAGSVDISGSGTSPAVLAYTPNPNWSGADTFVVQVSGGYYALSDSIRINVTVNPVNDPPTLDLDADTEGNDSEAVFVTGAGPIAVVDTDGLSLTDVDSGAIASATATITNLLDGASESLDAVVASRAIAASYAPATGKLTLTGPDSLANFQAALRTVTYDNANATPNATPRVIVFVVNDGDDDSAQATATVVIHDAQVQLTFGFGWNLLSMPFGTAPGTSPSQLLVTAGGQGLTTGAVCRWKAVDQEYEDIQAEFTGGEGFWAYCCRHDGDRTTDKILGRLGTGEIALRHRWNLVGPPVDVARAAIGGLSADVAMWYWDIVLQAYLPVGPGGVLRRGVGYWIYVNEVGGCVITFAR